MNDLMVVEKIAQWQKLKTLKSLGSSFTASIDFGFTRFSAAFQKQCFQVAGCDLVLRYFAAALRFAQAAFMRAECSSRLLIWAADIFGRIGLVAAQRFFRASVIFLRTAALMKRFFFKHTTLLAGELSPLTASVPSRQGVAH
jgi:hypothetical protein